MEEFGVKADYVQGSLGLAGSSYSPELMELPQREPEPASICMWDMFRACGG